MRANRVKRFCGLDAVRASCSGFAVVSRYHDKKKKKNVHVRYMHEETPRVDFKRSKFLFLETIFWLMTDDEVSSTVYRASFNYTIHRTPQCRKYRSNTTNALIYYYDVILVKQSRVFRKVARQSDDDELSSKKKNVISRLTDFPFLSCHYSYGYIIINSYCVRISF